MTQGYCIYFKYSYALWELGMRTKTPLETKTDTLLNLSISPSHSLSLSLSFYLPSSISLVIWILIIVFPCKYAPVYASFCTQAFPFAHSQSH